jgi:hypothetical protein
LLQSDGTVVTITAMRRCEKPQIVDETRPWTMGN